MRRVLHAMLADTPLIKNLENPEYMHIFSKKIQFFKVLNIFLSLPGHLCGHQYQWHPEHPHDPWIQTTGQHGDPIAGSHQPGTGIIFARKTNKYFSDVLTMFRQHLKIVKYLD